MGNAYLWCKLKHLKKSIYAKAIFYGQVEVLGAHQISLFYFSYPQSNRRLDTCQQVGTCVATALCFELDKQGEIYNGGLYPALGYFARLKIGKLQHTLIETRLRRKAQTKIL